MLSIFFASLEQSLIFLPLVLGMYISYRILSITDLTVDGTYVLGAAVFAQTLEYGILMAIFCSVLAGSIVGVVVSYMQRNNIVNDLVAGVLASFMLYSVNLQILGRPNISLLGKTTILSLINMTDWIIPLLILAIILIIILTLFLSSGVGLALRAFGQDQKLLCILGKSPENYRILGLVLSNMLASLTGLVAAQVNGFADINMGFGVALVGIGAVVIGRQLIIRVYGSFDALKEIIACFVGIFLYFSCMSILLRIGVNPIHLKLLLGIMLFFAMRKITYNGVRK